jgi:hypothetical protein
MVSTCKRSVQTGSSASATTWRRSPSTRRQALRWRGHDSGHLVPSPDGAPEVPILTSCGGDPYPRSGGTYSGHRTGPKRSRIGVVRTTTSCARANSARALLRTLHDRRTNAARCPAASFARRLRFQKGHLFRPMRSRGPIVIGNRNTDGERLPAVSLRIRHSPFESGCLRFPPDLSAPVPTRHPPQSLMRWGPRPLSSPRRGDSLDLSPLTASGILTWSNTDRPSTPSRTR